VPIFQSGRNVLTRGGEVAHIEKSIDIRKPVGAVYQEWTEFEEFPRFLDGLKEVGLQGAHLHWRAEVLTFAPRGGGTRVTVRIDYDAIGSGISDLLESVSRRLQRDLEIFKTSVEGGGAVRSAWKLAFTDREPSHA
jgi:uncharacterized membrane protein